DVGAVGAVQVFDGELVPLEADTGVLPRAPDAVGRLLVLQVDVDRLLVGPADEVVPVVDRVLDVPLLPAQHQQPRLGARRGRRRPGRPPAAPPRPAPARARPRGGWVRPPRRPGAGPRRRRPGRARPARPPRRGPGRTCTARRTGRRLRSRSGRTGTSPW